MLCVHIFSRQDGISWVCKHGLDLITLVNLTSLFPGGARREEIEITLVSYSSISDSKLFMQSVRKVYVEAGSKSAQNSRKARGIDIPVSVLSGSRLALLIRKL